MSIVRKVEGLSPMNHQEPFIFETERRLVMLTGDRARNLNELPDYITKVSGSSIFYHTHHQYLSHHFEKPVFHNDFAAEAGWLFRTKAKGC